MFQKRSQKCRDERGTWDIGAGALEYGLSPEENMIKEVYEEYGSEVLNYEFLGNMSESRKNPDGILMHWISFDYIVEVNRAQVIIGDPEAIDEIKWVKFDQMPSPLHSQGPIFLEKYSEKLAQVFES